MKKQIVCSIGKLPKDTGPCFGEKLIGEYAPELTLPHIERIGRLVEDLARQCVTGKRSSDPVVMALTRKAEGK